MPQRVFESFQHPQECCHANSRSVVSVCRAKSVVQAAETWCSVASIMNSPNNVMFLESAGTIGRATSSALVETGYYVVAPVLQGTCAEPLTFIIPCAMTEPALRASMTEHAYSAGISCTASRTSMPSSAPAINNDLNSAAPGVKTSAGASQQRLDADRRGTKLSIRLSG